MGFKEGHTINEGKVNNPNGRKGFEYEKDQLEKMKKHINSMFKMVQKISKGRATENEIKRFEILQKITLKMMDKIHANKQHIEHSTDVDSLAELTQIFRSMGKPITLEEVVINPLPTEIKEPVLSSNEYPKI